jgi:hypothetical protein
LVFKTLKALSLASSYQRPGKRDIFLLALVITYKIIKIPILSNHLDLRIGSNKNYTNSISNVKPNSG